MQDHPSAPFTRVGSREVYRTRWMRLREDTVRYRDGAKAPYGVVERDDFVMVIADRDGDLLLVRQYRHPIGRWTWELPQGACASGETEIEAARRELCEETGWEADEYQVLGRLFEASAFAIESFAVVRAKLRVRGTPRLDREEQGMESELVTPARFHAMVLNGEMQDAPSLAGLHLAAHAETENDCSPPLVSGGGSGPAVDELPRRLNRKGEGVTHGS